MKLSRAFLKRREIPPGAPEARDVTPQWAARQAEQDRAAEARATAPTIDHRTGERVPHCVGRRHKWNPLRSPHELICDRCGARKTRDR
jgi:hypothetical protein